MVPLQSTTDGSPVGHVLRPQEEVEEDFIHLGAESRERSKQSAKWWNGQVAAFSSTEMLAA
jgi:hypothetical protein